MSIYTFSVKLWTYSVIVCLKSSTIFIDQENQKIFTLVWQWLWDMRGAGYDLQVKHTKSSISTLPHPSYDISSGVANWQQLQTSYGKFITLVIRLYHPFVSSCVTQIIIDIKTSIYAETNSARWSIKTHTYQLQETQSSPYFINLTSQIQPVTISLHFFTLLFTVDMGSFFHCLRSGNYIFKTLMKFLCLRAELYFIL